MKYMKAICDYGCATLAGNRSQVGVVRCQWLAVGRCWARITSYLITEQKDVISPD